MTGFCQHCRQKLATVLYDIWPNVGRRHLCEPCYLALVQMGMDIRKPRRLVVSGSAA